MVKYPAVDSQVNNMEHMNDIWKSMPVCHHSCLRFNILSFNEVLSSRRNEHHVTSKTFTGYDLLSFNRKPKKSEISQNIFFKTQTYWEIRMPYHSTKENVYRILFLVKNFIYSIYSSYVLPYNYLLENKYLLIKQLLNELIIGLNLKYQHFN